MNKIRINQGRVMNQAFRLTATLMVACASVVIVVKLNSPLGFAVLCLLGFLLIPIWTAFYMLEIDLSKKVYSDVTMVLGKRFGESVGFYDLKEIYLRPQGYSQNYHRRSGAVDTIRYTKFDAYLKIDEKNIFLISDEDESELRERLTPIAQKLGVDIRQS